MGYAQRGGVSVLNRWEAENCINIQSLLTWFLGTAFNEAQQQGLIPDDEPFDMTFIYSTGKSQESRGRTGCPLMFRPSSRSYTKQVLSDKWRRRTS